MKVWGFREARPAPAWVNFAKTLAQVIVFWGFFLFLVPPQVAAMEQYCGFERYMFAGSIPFWACALLFGVAGSIGLWSALVIVVHGAGTPLPLDAPRKLVIVGPYRVVRNPMACCGLIQGVAVGLYLGSPAVLVYCMCGGLLWNYIARPAEERDLVARFGKPYCHYRDKVRCWLPIVRPYQSGLPEP